jgi:hypothetical protein
MSPLGDAGTCAAGGREALYGQFHCCRLAGMFARLIEGEFS